MKVKPSDSHVVGGYSPSYVLIFYLHAAQGTCHNMGTTDFSLASSGELD